ncbi:hypothetical protein AS149_37100 [Burkholderia cenocepacia]|nr:hypothetical protein AS149_37100 [Burkholderia cenocepacia]
MAKENRGRFDGLCRKHFRDCSGSGWSHLPKSDMTAFMREFYGDPLLEVYRLVEFCNPRTEYPEWRVDFSHSQRFLALQSARMAALGADASAASLQRSAAEAARYAREARDNPGLNLDAPSAQMHAWLESDLAAAARHRAIRAHEAVEQARAALFGDAQ